MSTVEIRPRRPLRATRATASSPSPAASAWGRFGTQSSGVTQGSSSRMPPSATCRASDAAARPSSSRSCAKPIALNRQVTTSNRAPQIEVAHVAERQRDVRQPRAGELEHAFVRVDARRLERAR